MPKTSLFLGLVLLAISAAAQSSAPKVKTVPAPYTSPASGKEMYAAYCASCHGTDAKGNGPAAAAMKAQPTDLTMLSTHNHGAFPEMRVYNVIKGDPSLIAHGSKDMPVWGPVFRALGTGDESKVHMRIANLTKYIQELQAK